MTQADFSNIWLISREYAGLAEAGGVKNVACALCEGLVSQKMAVTLFIPRYGCSDFQYTTSYTPDIVPSCRIAIHNNVYTVSFDKAEIHGVSVIFVIHQVFLDKQSVYTYTAQDEQNNPAFLRGTGFQDSLLMDVLFQKAVLEYGLASGSVPDIVHCQDAATALIPAFARCLPEYESFYKDSRFAVTIHNAGPGYHHEFESEQQAKDYTGLPSDVIIDAQNGNSIEPYLTACRFAALSTVSPWYAKELVDRENHDTNGLSALFSEKQIVITGITNGIDCNRYDPCSSTSSLLPYPFDPSTGDLGGKYQNRSYFITTYAAEQAHPEQYASFVRTGSLNPEKNGVGVYFCYHGRIVHQKGIGLLAAAAERLLEHRSDIRFILVGQGEAELENILSRLASEYAGRCVYFRGYDRAVSRLATAVSDFIVLPSLFEPCGLEDFIAQLYGTIPVAHATGGLNKIIDGKTGFLYTPDTVDMLYEKLDYLTNDIQKNSRKYRDIIMSAVNYVCGNYAWDTVIKQYYIPFYKRITR